jgi:hypothetical protein
VCKSVGWKCGYGRRRRWFEEEKLKIVAESFSGPRLVSSTARLPLHFDVAVVYSAQHYRYGACSSLRDSDHVFEHKLLSLRRLHFAKSLARSNEAVPPMYFP